MIKKVINLIDFQGHPALGEEFTNQLRYSTLAEIIQDDTICKDNCIIVSNTDDKADKKLSELKAWSLHRGWKWILIPNQMSIKKFINCVGKNTNFSIDKHDTEIIFGGTNTSGCVISSKTQSAAYFAAAGFNCKILLPLCADQLIAGVNDVEKNINSFARIYRKIKYRDLLQNIDIISKINEINFSKKR